LLDRDDPGRSEKEYFRDYEKRFHDAWKLAGPVNGPCYGRWPMSFRAYYRSLAYNQALDEYQDVVSFDREGRRTKIASLDHDHPMFGMYALRPKKPDELLLSKEAYMIRYDGRSAHEIVEQLNPGAAEVGRAKLTAGDVIYGRRQWREWKRSGDHPNLYRTKT